MYDISDIKNYILFLKRRCGLSITLHPFGEERLILSSELIAFNIHDDPYCIYVKTFPQAHRHCIERQCKITEKCKGGSFFGTCFAGVGEFVYPISNGRENVGFISVSGYEGDLSAARLSAAAQKYGIPAESLADAAASLKKERPTKEEVDVLLKPLCNMLELAYLKAESDGKNEEQPIDLAIRYIKQYHTQNITLNDICKRLSCSRSYLSHRFKTHTGQSFREYLTRIRIEDAKSLLGYSRLTVTEIALSVGFGDSAYFSKVFKKQIGLSPAAYRKRKMKNE